MGFDNDCIINIHSVAPEYFCPVCRTLVYPNEALEAQCSHLYCKPCLVHIASGAQTCPYDGNSVTEAGAKPVTVINRTLADAIGKIAVRCLYHRSGCMWQGPLSECIIHRSGCAFGDSQVLCMKCQIQIAHRQAEEHAQICNVNVMNPEVQDRPKNVWGAATSGAAVSSDQSKTAIQGEATSGHLQASQITPADNLNELAMANPQPQALPAMVMSTSQWYQPQYQQVYAQMYPYSLEATQPFNQAPLQVQGPAKSQAHAQLQPQSQVVVQQQVQSSMHMENQAHVLPLPQAQANLHPLKQAPSQVQARPHISFSGQHGPPLYPQAAMPGPNGTQAQLNPQQQIQQASLPHVQIQTHNQLLAHCHMPPQLSSQAPSLAVQGHAQQHMQVPQFQHSLSQMHHPRPYPWHPDSQSQSQPHTQGHPQSQSCPQLQHPHIQQVLQFPPQQHPHSLQVLQAPPQQHPHAQQVLQAPPQQHPHAQQVLQAPPQQHPHAQQVQVHPSTGFVPPVQVSSQFVRPIVYLRPLEPPQKLPSRGQSPGIPPVQQHTDPHSQPGLPVQQHPVTCQVQQPLPQQYVQLPQMFAGCTSGLLQGQLHHAGPFADQELGRTTKLQHYKPQSMKNSGMDANGPGANSNEKKHGAEKNDEDKPENRGGDDYRKDEAVIRDAVTELQEGQGVSCYPVATQRSEGGINNNLDHFPGGNLVQNKAVDVRDVPIYSVKQVEVNMNVQPPTHFKLAEHGHFSNPGQVSNPAAHFHPPAPNQPDSFYPQHQMSGSFAPCSAAMFPRGPTNFANHARSFKPQYEGPQRPFSHALPYGPPGFVSSSAPRLCYEQARAPIGEHPDAFPLESARHLDQGFPHQQQFFGDSSGTMSSHPCLNRPGSQSSYARQGFPNAGPYCAVRFTCCICYISLLCKCVMLSIHFFNYQDVSDSFDNLKKRKSRSMGWCRICNVDCESVKFLELHGQTREHQQMAMNMVKNIKQKSARIAITSSAHSGLGEARKSGSAQTHGCGSKP
ncbi:uncharacterized protein LOC112505682 isoform X2 [Cynara cardunculus var. scolymus]|uniref:uncharacterized protein LOC112505682 isoform X2 n=1 Tax=Cynara cardunculus var. scolymus TaxID=59895 RepID=UPI000D624C0D|nr:uncharacterized protein LOC112505682 isoform X2 [Cynara cardunculus var. scolymus]